MMFMRLRIPPDPGVTLIELLIAIFLLAAIILGINNLGVFSRYHFVSSDRRSRLQNIVSYCLEHMAKYAYRAIGNETIPGVTVVSTLPNSRLTFYMDVNSDGLRGAPPDHWAGYTLDTVTHQLNYCSDCSLSTCVTCNTSRELLSDRITSFLPSKNFPVWGNYINVSLTACWDPDQTSGNCGTSNNPSVNMYSTILLPSVSTN